MFGLFREKRPNRGLSARPEAAAPPSARAAKDQTKALCIMLSWKGLFGLILVFCILEMWMFFVGMWAAQTIVLPQCRPAAPQAAETVAPETARPVPSAPTEPAPVPAANPASAPDAPPHMSDTRKQRPARTEAPETDLNLSDVPIPPSL